MTSMPTMQRQQSASSLEKRADHKVPPGRVRHLYKTMDKNNSGGLSLAELKAGFARELTPGASLAPHVIAKLEEEFAKRATQEAGGGKALMPTVFSRFYCEMLFRHFDKDNNGTLELAEVSEALKYLVKPNADGVKVAPVVAYPPEFTTASGEVHLPIQWFWAHFSSME